MATSITSQVAAALLAQGKSAVEAELARIETDIAAAVTKGKAEAAVLATALANKLDAHAAETAAAQELLARTQGIGGTSPGPSPPSGASITLTKAESKLKSAWNWLNTKGWRGWVLLACGLLVLEYMYHHGILI